MYPYQKCVHKNVTTWLVAQPYSLQEIHTLSIFFL